jgi:hypothetical protein
MAVWRARGSAETSVWCGSVIWNVSAISPLFLQALHLEPDRLVQVGNRMVKVALAVVDKAAVAVGVGIFRIEPDRLVQVGDSAIVIDDSTGVIALALVFKAATAVA